MTNKMPSEWKASKRSCEKTPRGDTPETLIRNTKDIRHAPTEAERQRQPEADTWVGVTKERERLRVNKKTSDRHERPERYQLMERQGSVKRRAGLRFTIWEWLPSGWRNTIICYQLGSGALNSGIYTSNSVHTHTHTQHAGLSPHPRQDLHTPCTAPGCSMGHLLRTGRGNTMFSVWTKRGSEGRRGFRRSTEDDKMWAYNSFCLRLTLPSLSRLDIPRKSDLIP